jgi:hypothetical protein
MFRGCGRQLDPDGGTCRGGLVRVLYVYDEAKVLGAALQRAPIGGAARGDPH